MLPHVKFLLVDDLEENLLALEALLRREDLDILTARSGVEALELMLVHDFALAFLDVQMPEMDGFQLAELMRASEHTRQIPLIFVTAGAYDQHHRFKGYESGAVDFLFKPVNPYLIKNKAEVFFQLYRQKQLLARELEERTETLRMNETFTAVLGHDLRNPLGAILTAAHLLQKSEDELTRVCGQRIMSSGRRMGRMIDDILDTARMRLGGGIVVVREPANFGALVEPIVQEQQMAHPAADFAICTEGDLMGRWDGGRIAQMTSNLLTNALQHGAKDAPIEVHLDGRDKDSIVMSVINSGCIDAGLLDRIFEPFQGSAPESGAPKRGLGLGLYIVRQIVEAHEGRIDVECDGKRTVFRVAMPRMAQ